MSETSKTITISTSLIAAVAKWAMCSKEQRPHLHMLRFADDEVVACDGHRMVRVPYTTHGLRFGVDRDHVLSAVAVQRALKSASIPLDDDRKPALSISLVASVAVESQKRVKIHVAEGVDLFFPMRDATDYPPIEAIMPTKAESPDPDGHILNPKYLAAIAEVVEATSGGVERGVEVVAWSGASEGGARLGAMLLRTHEGIRFVLMPMRSA